MNFSKDDLVDSGINNYKFCGIWNNFAHYSKELREDGNLNGHMHIKVKERDVISGSYIFMLENDITYA